MALLSDREIRRLCVPPTFWKHLRADKELPAQPLSPPFSQYEYQLVEDFNNRSQTQPGTPQRPHYLTKPQEAVSDFTPMLKPFHDRLVRKVNDQAAVSFGLSSYGYDVTASREFEICTNIHSGILDPKAVDSRVFVKQEGDHVIVPPNSFILARTNEYFNMPKDVTGLVLTKSTYGRLGLFCLTTVIEAGWHGELVLEYANFTSLPVKFYAGEGAAQILFIRSTPCETPYDDSRKYQGQTGITHHRI